jgi:hypothetical protein
MDSPAGTCSVSAARRARRPLLPAATTHYIDEVEQLAILFIGASALAIASGEMK